MKWLTDLFLYAGYDRDKFLAARPEIMEENRRILIVFSAVAMLAMIGLLVASYFYTLLEPNRKAYVFCIIAFVILIITGHCIKDNMLAEYICIYVYVEVLLAFGIVIGPLTDSAHPAVNFSVLLLAVPLLYTDIPARMVPMIIINAVAFAITSSHTQSPEIIAFNKALIYPYGIVSVVACTFAMKTKVQRHVLVIENRFLSESDQLTGMLNRRCFVQKMESYSDSCPEGMMIISLDVNGLKHVNDTLGHVAGDELIRGAGECIDKTFSHYGTCYRIGGDEFVVLIDGQAPDIEEMKKCLQRYCSCFNGNLVSGLSISVGAARATGGENFRELYSRADRDMYEFKSEYYRQNGVDRRRRRDNA